MPIEARIRTLKYSPDEIKAIVIENLGESAKDSTVDVRFNITHQYDALDRGPGTPVLESVDVTITKGKK